MRDSIIFYRSFFEAIEELDECDRLRAIESIIRYGLYDEEPESGVEKAIFLMAKPQIDANNKRYKNGKNGGRPKTEQKPNHNQTKTKAKPNDNQTITKQKPNDNQTETKPKPNVNVNVNENVNVNNSNPPISPLKGWKQRRYSDNPELDKAIHDYIEHRKKSTGTFTDRAFELAMAKLDRLGKTDADKIAIINQSIENGWKGLFDIKARDGPAKKFNNEGSFTAELSDIERELLGTG